MHIHAHRKRKRSHVCQNVGTHIYVLCTLIVRYYVYYAWGAFFPLQIRGGGGGVNLTHTCLTASEGPVSHILCNIIEGTFKGSHQ